jgi:hypothetical protein
MRPFGLALANIEGVLEMSFGQLFLLAVVVTSAVVLWTAIVAAQEFRLRRAQRKQARVFAPAAGLLREDEDQALGPNPELLHAVRRLG